MLRLFWIFFFLTFINLAVLCLSCGMRALAPWAPAEIGVVATGPPGKCHSLDLDCGGGYTKLHVGYNCAELLHIYTEEYL